MTKKDYELIAKTIAGSVLASEDRRIIAGEFAEALRGTNPNFDTDRFVAACMGEIPKRKAKPVGTKSLERLLKF